MPVVNSTAAFFQDSSSFNLNEILKYVQREGIDPLWAEVEDSFEAIMTRKPKVDWGRVIQYAMCVDPGGGAMSGKLMQSGYFAPGDRTRNILGQIHPKHQTMTYEYDNFTGDISKGDVNAYIHSVEQEYTSKNSIFKTSLMLQLLADGTSRQATPVGFGDSDASSGATFTITDVTTPLKIKVGTSSLSIGSSAWFAEGQVISIPYIDRDLNNDGANEVTAANGRVRLLSLSFNDAGAGAATAYDTFRIVKIDQVDDAIYVMPARITGTIGNTDNEYTQPTEWVSGGTGTVTVTPVRGRSADGLLVATDTVLGATIADLNLVIGATEDVQYQALMHPGYLHGTQTEAKLQLGLGWTSSTEMSSLSKYVPTGLDTLLANESNTVHGVSRVTVLQQLPTIVKNKNKELTFNTFFQACAQHHARNRKKLPEWSVMYMNPLTQASLISLSEASRIIVEGEGVRGKKGAKWIEFEGKKFQFESSSAMRKDRIFGMADGCFALYDGNLKDVSFGGQKDFPKLVGGLRVDVTQRYANCTAETAVRNLRLNMVIKDFKTSALI